MIGTNASGARTVAYGATKDHVLALDVVMADGSLLPGAGLCSWTAPICRPSWPGDTAAGRAFAAVLPELARLRGQDPRRHAPGGQELLWIPGGGGPGRTGARWHPRRRRATTATAWPICSSLFVGAEGTLGLVTEATLNLVPLPAKRGIAMAYFPSVFAVGEAVPGILALSPTAVEIMDSRFLALVRRHDSRIDAMLPERTDTALLIEFEGGDDAELDEKFAALAPPPRRHRRPAPGARHHRRRDRAPLEGAQVGRRL